MAVSLKINEMAE